jgi:outer membrane protein assembly factor BamB
MFGYSSSPLLFDGRLYVQVIRNKKQNRYGQGPDGSAESYLLALDPATGKDLWKQERPTDARDEGQEAYSSPIPFTEGGRREVLVCGGDYLTGHDPATGKELWRWAGYNTKHINHWRIIPSPVVAEGLVFVAGPKHSTLFAVRPEGQGDLAEKSIAWTFERQFPDAASMLAYQGRLYALDDDGKVMTALVPKTGEKKWQLPLGGDHVFRASPLGADGKIYCMNEVGEVFVLAAGDEPKLLHRVVMGSGPVCRSTIVAAGGRLYVRTTDTLFSIGKGEAK